MACIEGAQSSGIGLFSLASWAGVELQRAAKAHVPAAQAPPPAAGYAAASEAQAHALGTAQPSSCLSRSC